MLSCHFEDPNSLYKKRFVLAMIFGKADDDAKLQHNSRAQNLSFLKYNIIY